MRPQPKIVDGFGYENVGRADYKEKMKHFPVKYCETCKRCYEGSDYFPGFPTIGLERRECHRCEKAKKST